MGGGGGWGVAIKLDKGRPTLWIVDVTESQVCAIVFAGTIFSVVEKEQSVFFQMFHVLSGGGGGGGVGMEAYVYKLFKTLEV